MIREAVDPVRESLTALGVNLAKLEDKIAGANSDTEARLALNMTSALDSITKALAEQVSTGLDTLEQRVRAMEHVTSSPHMVETLRTELAAARWEADHWKEEARRLAQHVLDAVPAAVGTPA